MKIRPTACRHFKNLCKLCLRLKFGLRTKSDLFYQVTQCNRADDAVNVAHRCVNASWFTMTRDTWTAGRFGRSHAWCAQFSRPRNCSRRLLMPGIPPHCSSSPLQVTTNNLSSPLNARTGKLTRQVKVNVRYTSYSTPL